MSAGPPSVDLGSEREIDLGRWRAAIRARLWWVIAGLVIGLVIGGLYSLRGASTYSATVTIQPAQPESPTGGAVLNYTSSPAAIQLIVTSTAATDYAAKVAKMPASKLAGSVSTASVSTGAGPVTTRGTVLIEVTVAIDNKVEAAAAANALGNYVVQQTEGQYVRDSLQTYAETDASYVVELHALSLQINTLSREIAVDQNQPLIDKLVLDSAYADAVQRQGTYEQQLSENQESADLANEVYVAQIINKAASSKVTSRSRKDSVVFGGVIGLLIGLIVALYLGLRRPARPVRTA
jgi:uncharacterized protein involved in exopolysaccharide biosynthesis